MRTTDVQKYEYSTFNATYIKAAGEVNLMEELEISLHDFIRFVQNIPMDKFDYRYAEGKWTIKEIIQHIIDTERIFAYRALRISRNDLTPLHGFDENIFAANTPANSRTIQDLLTEFSAVIQSNLLLFKSNSDHLKYENGDKRFKPIIHGSKLKNRYHLLDKYSFETIKSIRHKKNR